MSLCCYSRKCCLLSLSFFSKDLASHTILHARRSRWILCPVLAIITCWMWDSRWDPHTQIYTMLRCAVTPTYLKQLGEDSLPTWVSWAWQVACRVEMSLCWWWWQWYIPQLQHLPLTCIGHATPLNTLLIHGKELRVLFQITPVPLPHTHWQPNLSLPCLALCSPLCISHP